MPTGSPSTLPAGADIAGNPTKLHGMALRASRMRWRSASPTRGAVVAVVGMASTSALSKQRSRHERGRDHRGPVAEGDEDGVAQHAGWRLANLGPAERADGGEAVLTVVDPDAHHPRVVPHEPVESVEVVGQQGGFVLLERGKNGCDDAGLVDGPRIGWHPRELGTRRGQADGGYRPVLVRGRRMPQRYLGCGCGVPATRALADHGLRRRRGQLE